MIRLAKAMLVVGLALFGAFIAWGVIRIWLHEREVDRRGQCFGNVTALTTAAVRYAQDHGGRFPPARDWCDCVRPYLDDPSAFVCPETRNQRCSYAFNANLSGVRLADIPASSEVVVFFESDQGWNAAGGPELLPARPRHGLGLDTFGLGNGREYSSLMMSRGSLVKDDYWRPQPKRQEGRQQGSRTGRRPASRAPQARRAPAHGASRGKANLPVFLRPNTTLRPKAPAATGGKEPGGRGPHWAANG